MTDRELKKLSRAALLELLVTVSEENETLLAERAVLIQQLRDRTLLLRNAGSIAEASLQLSGVFEDAQRAADQYLENIRRLSESAQAEADALLAETQRECALREDAARRQCDILLEQAGKKCETLLSNFSQLQDGLKEDLDCLRDL